MQSGKSERKGAVSNAKRIADESAPFLEFFARESFYQGFNGSLLKEGS